MLEWFKQDTGAEVIVFKITIFVSNGIFVCDSTRIFIFVQWIVVLVNTVNSVQPVYSTVLPPSLMVFLLSVNP